MADDPAGERIRLEGLLDDYLEALDVRTPARLPVAPHVRFTENTQALPLGAGLWRTLRALHSGGQRFVDPDTGQVAFWGVVEELRGTALFGVRLRVEGRLLSEVETLLVRGSAYFAPEVLEAPSPGLHAAVATDERATRGELVAAASAYFDAIERSDGSRLRVAGDCRRLVNGVSDSDTDPAVLPEGEQHRALGIVDQMSEGHYAYIESIRERRFPLVDIERGLAHAVVLFDHPGDLARPSGEVPFGAPNTMLYFEVFKVRGGELVEISAIGSNPLPYGTSSGWRPDR